MGMLIKLVEDARRRQKKLVCFKVVFKKAYDSMSWQYLIYVMERMDLDGVWRNRIRECVLWTRTLVLVNESLTHNIISLPSLT